MTRTFKTATEYTCTIKLTLWEPIPKSVDSPVTHPESDEAVIDPASDYDPAMDAVIPFAMKLTNTTKGFDLEEPQIQYWLAPSTRDVTDSMKEPRTLEAWDWYADGMSSTLWNVYATPDDLIVANQVDGLSTVRWSEPLATGDAVTHYGYFVYRDQRTPAEPDGSKWVLDFIVVMPSYTVSSATGPKTTKGLSLTGAVEEVGIAW